MVYLYRNKTNFVQLPYFENIAANDVEFTIDDGCLQYPIAYNVIEVCNSTIKADITIPNLDLKKHYLSLNDDNHLLKKYEVVIQEKDDAQVIGQPIGSALDDEESEESDDDNSNDDNNENMNNGNNSGELNWTSKEIDLTPQVIEAAEDIKDNLNADLAALMDL